MQQSRGRRLTPQDHEEDERVVYCGLETDSHSRSLLLSRDDASSPCSLVTLRLQQRPKRLETVSAATGCTLDTIFLCSISDSEDEAGAEKSNPFESLLLQQQTTRQTEVAEVPPETEMSVSWNDVGTGYMESSRIKATGDQSKKTEENRDSGRMSSFKKISSHSCENEETSCLRPKSMQESEEFTTRFRSAGDKKKLGFEAAESRPARWSSRKPSAVDTKNRRKSLSGIQRQRLQVEANVAKRRKSMPVNLLDPHVSHNRASEDGRTDGPRRLMSDVLQRATLLSQRPIVASNEEADEDPMIGDTILDTEHQMRSERFQPQIFSPAKSASMSTALCRTRDAGTVMSKIRGGIGGVICKSIRKSNRDLTLLRSHCQHLLSRQRNHSSSAAFTDAIMSVQDRAYVIIRLTRFCGSPHFIAYECRMHQVTCKLEKTIAGELMKDSAVLEAHFQPQTAEYLRLSPKKLLKVFEPLHFFREHAAVGSISKPKWFLASTQLTQVITSDRHDAE